MQPWRGRERRSSGEVSAQLRRVADGQDKLRESLHDLRGTSQVMVNRIERLERDVRDVEAHVEAAEAIVQQLRGALATMRALAGGSLVTAAAAVAGMGRAFGWW